jgi:hypothetical protein
MLKELRGTEKENGAVEGAVLFAVAAWQPLPVWLFSLRK